MTINDRLYELGQDFSWHTGIPLEVALSVISIILSLVAITIVLVFA